MDLTEEYKNQAAWRNWESYIEKLPLTGNETILDLGCSVGTVSELFSQKAHRVIGIDNNPELLKEAELTNSSKNLKFILGDLNDLQNLKLPLCDGIWTSFVPAYFPDFAPVLKSWMRLLKPEGWIALVEMSDLFYHRPLGSWSQEIFQKYYNRQQGKGIYDFQMGSKLNEIVLSCGLTIIHEEDMDDPELTFNGAAEPEILKAWNSRFERMDYFRKHIGRGAFLKLKDEFLNCLASDEHVSGTIVKFIVARKE
jgi:ubiquinone/menaquinone biosynthesis C-methylase UbiE